MNVNILKCSDDTESPFNTPSFEKVQWIWWMFSLYYFVPLFYMPLSKAFIAISLFAYVAFIVISKTIVMRAQRGVYLPLAGLILLATITANFTVGASTFFTYAGFFIGFYLPLRQFFYWTGGVLLIILALHFYYKYPVPYFLLQSVMGVITIGLVGIIERIRVIAKRKEHQSHQEIRQLAMIAERERIARDLHDILGHTLSSIALKAELAEKLLNHDKLAESKQHLRELNTIARDSLSLVRKTVSGYKHRGFAQELTALCEQLRQNNFSVQIEGEFPKLDARAETALILALTELTTNVLRHSKGRECELHFQQTSHQLIIRLCDNGKVDEIVEGNGLSGIRERLHALAGTLDIDLSNGSCFTITLPAQKSSSDDETSNSCTFC